MAWQIVAQGASLQELKPLVTDMEFTKGTRLWASFNPKLPLAWAFDAPGAEQAFRLLAPPGVDILDVYGKAGHGIVEMEADPVWLLALLGFISAHWGAITIGGIALGLIGVALKGFSLWADVAVSQAEAQESYYELLQEHPELATIVPPPGGPSGVGGLGDILKPAVTIGSVVLVGALVLFGLQYLPKPKGAAA